MAIVTRYFSTAAAGAGDGTTWADRAILFTGGVWSTVITGFDFSGADSMIAYVGPGTYTITNELSSVDFTTAQPTNSNPLLFHGCDSSGNPLSPPDHNWKSCEPDWDWSVLPLLTCSTIRITSTNFAGWRLMAFSIAYNGVNTSSAPVDWIFAENTAAGTSVGAFAPTNHVTNSIFRCTGATYDAVLTAADIPVNCRVYGNPNATSGNRDGVKLSQFSAPKMTLCTIFGNAGRGAYATSTNAGYIPRINRSVIADNSGDGFDHISTAAQTNIGYMEGCMITGNGGYGVDCQSQSRVLVMGSRLRDNASGNFNGMGNIPETFGNYTTDSDDASEYVDGDNATLSLRDYTIKAGATIHGMGFGVAEQASGGSVFPVLGPSIIQPGRIAA